MCEKTASQKEKEFSLLDAAYQIHLFIGYDAYNIQVLSHHLLQFVRFRKKMRNMGDIFVMGDDLFPAHAVTHRQSTAFAQMPCQMFKQTQRLIEMRKGIIDNDTVHGVVISDTTLRDSNKNKYSNSVNKSKKQLSGGKLTADKIIVATGGVSYPRTGASDSGYRFAEGVGHSIVKAQPSLVPFEVKEDWCKELMGLSLKNVVMTVYASDKGKDNSLSTKKIKRKLVFEDFGEMLFTHFGVSGPMVIKASAYIHKYLGKNIELSIDLKPALSEKQLDERILRDFEMFKNKQLSNGLEKLLLKSLIPVIIDYSGLDGNKRISEITKEERRILLDSVKNLKMHITGLRGWDEAIITKGGVNVKEIDPSTMESKKVKGLYFAGEVLDVDALTGGFNLQVAWSTGYLAGNS